MKCRRGSYPNKWHLLKSSGACLTYDNADKGLLKKTQQNRRRKHDVIRRKIKMLLRLLIELILSFGMRIAC